MDIIQYQFAIYSSSKNCPNVLHFCNVYNTTLNKDIIPKKYITNTALSQFAFGQELDSQYINKVVTHWNSFLTHPSSTYIIVIVINMWYDLLEYLSPSLPLTTTISSLLAVMAVGGTTILPNLLH